MMFPASDPLNSVGPDNQTFWLMMLVRSEAIVQFKFIYYAAIALEVSLTLTGYYLHYRGSMLILKYRILHINFLILNANVYVVMLIGSLARLVIILYETRLIELPSLGYEPVPTLSMVRQASFGQAFFALYFITIERFCATFFVRDYERNKRLHISAVLCIGLTGSSVITAYVIVTGTVNGALVAALALLPNIFCAIMFRLMLIHNKKRHARLTNKIKRDADDEYSLSLRVQLNENIWSMQKIEFGVYAITAALFINLLFVFLPVFVLAEPDQFELLQWFTCAANVGFAFTITATAPILEIAIAIHKGNIPSFLIRLLGREFFGTVASIKEKRDETEVYFIQLSQQWAHAITLPEKR